MKNTYHQHHADLIQKILSALSPKAEANLRQFTREFYAKMPVADLEKIEAKRAVALAQSAYEFMNRRNSYEPKIRIFTPEKSKHGYESRTTVIELLNDDMPFLVDSLSAELTRQGFIIRETIHPIFNVQRDKEGRFQSLVA